MLRLASCLVAGLGREIPERGYTMSVWDEMNEDAWKWERDARVIRRRQALSLMDALDDAEEALLRAYLRSGWQDIRDALALVVRLKDSNQERKP